jgi:4-hydroxy-3-methylbut-2-enyl diphosphate reductase
MKTLITAPDAGFCYGVRRSVKLAEELLRQGEGYCIGELIHNDDVVRALEARGLHTAQSVEEIPDGAQILIRSHGVSEETLALARAKASQLVDATCPHVGRIHEIVSRASQEGRHCVIIGSENHPEVVAIRGWCAVSDVFPDAAGFENWLLEDAERGNKPLCVVFQTTQKQKNLEESKNLQKKLCTNCQVFDTICSATSIRQEQCALLAQKCDAIIVIGGKHSANSLHLAAIAGEGRAGVQFISGADELDLSLLEGADAIGITAGASTPAWIIKEVKQTMTDEFEIQETTALPTQAEEKPATESELTFDQMLEESIKTIYNGDTVTGVVAAITPTEISVDLGTKQSGYIPVTEFTDDTETPIDQIVKIGDSIEATVVRVNDVEGTVMLSKKRLDAAKNWVLVEDALGSGAVLEGVVTEENKGGVVVNVKGVRVFVPASQTGLPKDAQMDELLRQKVALKIKEVNRSRRRVVGSIRDVLRDARREKSAKIWNEIEIGKRYNGVVKSLTGYGAFVDIGGIDGMVHVSELSWNRVRQPSEVLSVGQEIEVYVINFDRDSRKISLGFKDPDGNPWAKFTEKYKEGDIIDVKIVKLMAFGAFAEVMPGVDGLIHISQIAGRRIAKPDEVLKVGETVTVKIVGIDNDKKKISLSIRALNEPERKQESEPTKEEEPEAPESDALVYEVTETGEATGNLPEADLPEGSAE